MSLNSGLIFKWLKSENTSSAESKAIAKKTRNALGLTARQYRKMLSYGRKKTKVLETIMSAGEWDRIDFSKIPSRAGFIYRNAFARHDVERMKAKVEVQSYADFVRDDTKKVNAKDLYPYEVVAKAYNLTYNMNRWGWNRTNIPELTGVDPTERAAINKYWDNLKDYFNGCSFNGLCMCDTSGSMWSENTSAPINVAISIALYCAERGKGPFANHYISFSSRPQLIETVGIDFCDKVQRIYKTNLCENTNIEAAFDMLLNIAIRNRCTQEDIPQNIIVVTDMEFDAARSDYGRYHNDSSTLMENIEKKWNAAGYKIPSLIFWNVEARQDNIPMQVKNGISYVSGFSPVLFEQIMKGKTAYDLMYDKLDSNRYSCIK